jgi:hypothetical protein
MKKSLPRLVVRSETIRMLATLEFAHAVGGIMPLEAKTETCKVVCTLDIAAKLPAGG